MTHKQIKVYVDDIIAKIQRGEDHINALRVSFYRLREFKLRINLSKCIFEATLEKLPVFVVSSKEIKVDPSKIKAICELQAPSTVKEVQSLSERLNYLARFISQLSEIAKPFFKLLRNNAQIEWDKDYQDVFDELRGIWRNHRYSLYRYQGNCLSSTSPSIVSL